MRRINRTLQKIEIGISSILVAAIFILTAINIIMRYVFNKPIISAEEIILFMFIWLGFLTASYTMSIDKHIRLELIADKFKAKGKKFLYIVIDLMIVMFFIYMMPSALLNIKYLSISPALELPLKYIYIIVPVSYMIMIFHTITNIVGRIRQKETEVK